MFFPTKTIHSNIEYKNGVRVRSTKPKTIQVQADAYKTYRFYKTSETETLTLLEKFKFFKEIGIVCGPPIHDDLPCKLIKNPDERKVFSDKLTKHIRNNVPNNQHALVNSHGYQNLYFTRKSARFERFLYTRQPYQKSHILTIPTSVLEDDVVGYLEKSLREFKT